MAFMHFGNFLEGMRLSAQDIADKEKAALNERYMNEQMATMQLGRDNTRLGMEETRMEMARKPKQWEQEDQKYNWETYKNRLSDRLSALSQPLNDPQVSGESLLSSGNTAIYDINAMRAELGIPRMNIGGVEFDEKTGEYFVADEEGRPLTPRTKSAKETSGDLWRMLRDKQTTEEEEAAALRDARARSGGGGANVGFSPNPGFAETSRKRNALMAQVAADRRALKDVSIDAALRAQKQQAIEDNLAAVEQFDNELMSIPSGYIRTPTGVIPVDQYGRPMSDLGPPPDADTGDAVVAKSPPGVPEDLSKAARGKKLTDENGVDWYVQIGDDKVKRLQTSDPRVTGDKQRRIVVTWDKAAKQYAAKFGGKSGGRGNPYWDKPTN